MADPEKPILEMDFLASPCGAKIVVTDARNATIMRYAGEPQFFNRRLSDEELKRLTERPLARSE